MSEQEEREQKRREYRALLEGFWPDAFNFSRPRPLKVGILAELIGVLRPFPPKVSLLA
ncbi:hypothetical protein AB6A48_004614 [Escherichia coli]